MKQPGGYRLVPSNPAEGVQHGTVRRRDRLPTPALGFCYPRATSLRFRSGGHPAVKPTAPLSRHNPHDARELRLESWRSTSVEICASKAALCATGRARTAADTNAVHDRLLQSMRVQFSGSEQWSSPVNTNSTSE